MVADKRIAANRGRQPRFDDGAVSGDPEFALAVLHKRFTDLLMTGRVPGAVRVVLQSELLTSEDDGVAEVVMRGGIWVTAVGELANQELADQITELACDLLEALPPDALKYHLEAPVPAPPGGTWGNELPGRHG